MVKNVVYAKVLRYLFSVGSFLFNLAITLYFLLASICIFFLKNLFAWLTCNCRNKHQNNCECYSKLL